MKAAFKIFPAIIIVKKTKGKTKQFDFLKSSCCNILSDIELQAREPSPNTGLLIFSIGEDLLSKLYIYGLAGITRQSKLFIVGQADLG